MYGGKIQPWLRENNHSDFTWTKSNLLLLSKKMKVKVVQSCPTLCHCTQSTEFSRPEYWSG